ncbi:MAG: InlB B-repeat-containing protein, partial [Bacilli bacterium]|nr:InlB B-repeat-containing protein [Bacilli bacterium]
QDAIEAARISNKTIYIIKDFEAAYPVEVKEGYDVTINMNSYNITTGNQITNNGTLRIYDDSENKGSINSARSIVNNGTFTLEDILIKQNKSVDAISNPGVLIVKNATINSTDHSAIYSTGSLTVDNSILYTASNYALNNAGELTLTGNYEINSGSTYGLLNSGTMNDSINSGKITGISTNKSLTIDDGAQILGITNGILMSGANTTLTMNGGTVKGANSHSGIINSSNVTVTINDGEVYAGTGLYCDVANSTFNVNGGTITGTGIAVRLQRDNCHLNVNDAEIVGSSYGIYTYGYYNRININGTVRATNGMGIRDERDKNSTDAYYSHINITGGLVQGTSYGMEVRYSAVTIENAEVKNTSTNRDQYAYYADYWNSLTLKDGAFINAPTASAIRSESSISIYDGARIYAGAYNGFGIRGHYTIIRMYGGSIETPGSEAYGILCNDNYYTDIIMEGGSIDSGYIGVALHDNNSSYTRSFNMSGGSITSELYGLYVTQPYIITIGHEDDELFTTIPYITGGLYGLYRTSGTAYFYNGRLRGYNYGYKNDLYFKEIRDNMYIHEEHEEYDRTILTYATSEISEEPVSRQAKYGNGYVKITYLGESNDTCNTNQLFIYDYIGHEEELVVPCTGKYSLELWGASGGGTIPSANAGSRAGAGGYSYGEIDLEVGEKLYINVGGAGLYGAGSSPYGGPLGGYNGGGYGSNNGSGSGGGATHIATKSGLLSTLSNNRDSVLIVAGGGGGSDNSGSNKYGSDDGSGGSGGGYIAGAAFIDGGRVNRTRINISGMGGTQTHGYAFGQGENVSANTDTGGAGAGWYGGYVTNNNNGGAGGGSGYIGNSRIYNGVMYGYEIEESPAEWISNYLVPLDAFLQVGDQTFNNFKDASEAIAENGTGTILVLKNARIEDTPTIVGNRTITIDLQGHVLETTNRFVNNANTTFVDSSENKTGELKALVDNVIENKGNLTFDSVKVTGTATDSSAIWGSTGTGTITLKDSTVSSLLNGVICDASQSVVIENTSITASSCGIRMNKPNSSVTVHSGTITATSHGIYFQDASSSSLLYEDGTISVGDLGIYFNNSSNSTLTYKKGTITSSGNAGIDFYNSHSSTIKIENINITSKHQCIYNYSQSNNWTIDKATMTSTENVAIDFVSYNSNRNTLTIKDGTYQGATHGAVLHSVNATLDGGTFKTTSTSRDNYALHVEYNTTLNVNDGVIIEAPNASGIYANEVVNLKNTSVTSGAASGYGIYHNSGNLNITGTTITANDGIQSPSNNGYTINFTDSTIDASNFGIYVNGTGTKTLNINSGTIDGDVIGLFLKGNNTTTNLGIKDEPLSTENPHIISDNIAINNNFGNLNFYSGLLTSTQRVLTNEVDDIRKDKEVHYDYTINEGEVATLTSFNHSQSATSNYAKEGNGYARVTYLEHDGSLSTASSDSYENVNVIGNGNGACDYQVGDVFEFEYTGSEQTFTVNCPGQYQLEVWGAQGGGNDPDSNTGSRAGKGGYTKGITEINIAGTELYVYVGQAGKTVNSWTVGGWNGGGGAVYTGNALGTGGGATDIRLVPGSWDDFSSLRSRIIVAGAGGGADDTGSASGTYHSKISGEFASPGGNDNDESGGAGGGLNGGGAVTSGYEANYGYGTQISGGYSNVGANGGFGYGGGTSNSGDYGGGGGGYYGGGSGGANYQGGGGGSSYVSGYDGCDTTYLDYQKIGNDNLTFTDVSLEQGVRKGDGYAKITVVSLATESVVTLNPGIGTVTDTTLNYDLGDELSNLPTPTITSDYVFDGWYLDRTFTKKVTTNTKIYYSVNLYAKYKSNITNCSDLIGTVYNYDHIGDVQTFTAYCPGKYKIEAWGASGGVYGANTKYGYGGYTTGEITLNTDELIYIYAGGQGDTNCVGKCRPSYNGGGIGLVSSQAGSNGGGATHIAKSIGTLDKLSDNRSSILIVAGGGGGSGASGVGGSGGGYIGGDGLDIDSNNGYTGFNGTGGTQETGGKTYNNANCALGTFGKGANVCDEGYGGSGAGGGFFGGGGSNRGHGGAGGGSGYVNESQVSNGQMYGYNVPSRGHSTVNAYLSSKQGFLEVSGNVYSSFETAIAALDEEGGTIKVLNHASIKEDVTFPADKTITLDMNGYELTFNKTIINESILTIKNITDNDSALINTSGDVINNKGSIVVNNVDLKTGSSGACIRGTTGNGSIALLNSSTLSGGNAIITDVKQNITVTDSIINVGSYGIKVNQGNGIITVTNSSIKSSSIGVELNSATNTLNVTNSSFDTQSTSINIPGTTNTTTIDHSNIKSSGTGINVGGNSNTITIEDNTFNVTTGINMTGSSLRSTINDNIINASTTGISSTGGSCVSTLDGNDIRSNNVGINHRGDSNTMTITDLTVKAISTGVYHSGNNSTMTITGGTIESTSGSAILDETTTNTNTKAILELNDLTITGTTNSVHLNYTVATVNNCEITTTSNSADHYGFIAGAWCGATINNSFINAPNASGTKTDGTFEFNNSRIYAGNEKAYGLYVINGTIIYNNTILEAPGLDAYGIYLSDVNATYSRVTMDGGSISAGNIGVGLYCSYSGADRFFNLKAGTIKGETYGLYVNQNYNLTVGSDTSVVDIYAPSISGGLYGVYKTTGNAEFYSGRLKGSTKAYYGAINTIKDGYEIFEDREEMEEYERQVRTYNTTSISSDAVSKYAKEGNGYAKITYNQFDNTEVLPSNYEIVNTIDGGEQVQFDFDYTGDYQEFIAPVTGDYKIELWGASGGINIIEGLYVENQGEGGYTSGTIRLEANEKLYIFVGGQGKTGEMNANVDGGYNGGGQGRYASDVNDGGGSGGGATDVRLASGEWNDFNSLKSRIMVAAGGGGGATVDRTVADKPNSSGISGGLYGYGDVWRWQSIKCTGNYHATQTSGYAFGYGQAGKDSHAGGAGAGGGYYGATTSLESSTAGASGASSSFISGHEGCNAISASSTAGNIVHTGQSVHYSNKSFTNTEMIDAAGCKWTNDITNDCSGQPQPDGTVTAGHTGNGHARVTLTNGNSSNSVQSTYNYEYTGDYQEFVAPVSGNYSIELWGASGGSVTGYSIGLGGYTKGEISLRQNEKLYIYVGGEGKAINNGTGGAGWNGGGDGINVYDSNNRSSGGGGATDVRLVNGSWNDLSGLMSRIMVAAGAGGASNYSGGAGGGGLIGIRAPAASGAPQYNGGGGTQTSPGTVSDGGYGATNATFGAGSVGSSIGGGGGGGYYGGAGGARSGPQDGSGGGGSSFISGHDGCDALSSSSTYDNLVHTGQSIHYSNKSFTNTLMIDGEGYDWTTERNSYVGQPQPDGTTTTGHTGNGYARIKLLEVNSTHNNTYLTYTYDYTGHEEVFNAYASGKYKIEIWGAQGGTSTWSQDVNYAGGYGGYSTGILDLTAGDKLYVNVGGAGQDGCLSICDGGYNGGGIAGGATSSLGEIYNVNAGSGGGATHIATKSGLLRALEDNKSSVLMVAGGGGGSLIHRYNNDSNWWRGYGGHAGGYLSVSGTIPKTGRSIPPTSASQSAGGIGYNDSRVVASGSFGRGQDGIHGDGNGESAGAGGGWYGGGASVYTSTSGGSGYIGNSLVSNKYMYCYNCETSTDVDTYTKSDGEDSCHSINPIADCAKEGNGYVKITYIGNDQEFGFSGSVQTFTAPSNGQYKIELWGAQGGTVYGGNGAYTSGTISLQKNDKLYVYTGGQANTFNGGGECSSNTKIGGGATDIRLVNGDWDDSNSLASRIMVAAGGGSVSNTSENAKSGVGGALHGEDGVEHNEVARSGVGSYRGGGGTQVSGGTKGYNSTVTATPGTFGIGGTAGIGVGDYNHIGAGGGGGYYGGGGSAWHAGSGGGSSYISGYTGAVAITSQTNLTPRESSNNVECTEEIAANDITCSMHYSGKVFDDTVMLSGNQEMPSRSGDSTIVGNTGDGYAKISFLSSDSNYYISLITYYGTISSDSIVYSYGELLGDLPEPIVDESELLEFDGWYLDKEYTKKVTSTTMVKGNAVLYAKFNHTSNYCSNIINTSYTFDFISGEEEFLVPCTGTYTLEVWGAQGGSANTTSSLGGYGGYSVAKIDLSANETLYINVGGQGQDSTSMTMDTRGGYNGGGNAYHWVNNDVYTSAGGGATHIATTSGVLSALENSKDKILIVAGGGGGAGYWSGAVMHGGHAGGFIGGNGVPSTNGDGYYGLGGTQTAGGKYVYSGSYTRHEPYPGTFGKGGNSYITSNATNNAGGGSGGGGGYYGGGGSAVQSSAGGGSGYIGNSRLKDQAMYGYSVRNTYDSEDLTVAYLVPALDKIYNVEQDRTYNNIQDAFSEVQDGETLQLTRISSISYDVTIPNKVITLDLNGHNLITNKSLINNGTLTIVDSTNTQGISISSTISNTLITN